MSNPLLNFLLDKKSKGLPMNIGQAMSELDIWREGKISSFSQLVKVKKHNSINNNNFFIFKI